MTDGAHKSEYVVVARRYRPQTFRDLVGQEMVSQALCNALTTDRVGHAYLFTGARGVGKTSSARILAKSLNCEQGPTTEPCGVCDICQRVSNGDDVDVLEIDGASNRGIDEIRQLRSNVGVRPSRGRFKIYIIDEVHMLTKEAFNALLKTLEEPPDHVKFVFCTTEPDKIPVTVLSRCQRFDFAPVLAAEIVKRLQFIVDNEGAEADSEALELLARRAAGSMRDSQSLLEQLLSFVTERITVEHVHSMLGTARDERLQAILSALNQRDAARAMGELDRSILEGVDAGQLAEQLIGSVRDMMAALVGCEADLLLQHRPSQLPELKEAAATWGLETLLAAVQVLDQSIARMRQSVHARILLELALVRIAHLENLDSITGLIEQLQTADGQQVVLASPTAATAPPSSKGTANARSASAGEKKNSSDVAEQTERPVVGGSAAGGAATRSALGDPAPGLTEAGAGSDTAGSTSDMESRDESVAPQSPSSISSSKALQGANPGADGGRPTDVAASVPSAPPVSDSDQSTDEACMSEAAAFDAAQAASSTHRIDASVADPVPADHVSGKVSDKVSGKPTATSETAEASTVRAVASQVVPEQRVSTEPGGTESSSEVGAAPSELGDLPVEAGTLLDSECTEAPANDGADERSVGRTEDVAKVPGQGVAKREAEATRAATASDASGATDAKPGAELHDSANESDSKPTPPGITIPFEESRAREIWRTALATMNDMTPDHGAVATSVAISGPNRLVVRFSHVYTSSKSFCERAERRQALETTLAQIVGKPIRLEFELIADRPQKTEKKAPVSKQKLRQMVTRNPFVERAVAVFEAEVIGVDLGGNR